MIIIHFVITLVGMTCTLFYDLSSNSSMLLFLHFSNQLTAHEYCKKNHFLIISKNKKKIPEMFLEIFSKEKTLLIQLFDTFKSMIQLILSKL